VADRFLDFIAISPGGFVLAKIGGGFVPSAGGIEPPDRGLTAREGAALVAIEACEPFDGVEIPGRNRAVIERAARLPNPHELDVRRRDLLGVVAAARPRLGATHGTHDRFRQSRNRTRPGRVGARRTGQPMAAGVARRARLAGRRPRPGTPLRIAAVGVDLAQTRHTALLSAWVN
jgi:hypothetical protein